MKRFTEGGIFVGYKQRCTCNNFKLSCYKKEQDHVKNKYKNWIKCFMSEINKKGSSLIRYKQKVWIAECSQCKKQHLKRKPLCLF